MCSGSWLSKPLLLSGILDSWRCAGHASGLNCYCYRSYHMVQDLPENPEKPTSLVVSQGL